MSQDLLIDKHVQFIQAYDKHLRVSGVYWGYNALCLLGQKEALSKDDMVRYIMSCQLPNGSFAAHHGHDGHLMNTVYAVQVLVIQNALDQIDSDRVADYVASLQNRETGSFAGDEWGESDARFVYGAFNCLSILGKLDKIDVELSVQWILQCQNLDGGFGPEPGAESHGANAIAKALDRCNWDKICFWLCERQVPNGGLNGRPEKLPDSCYSWWELSGLALMNRLHWIDREGLIKFILAAQNPTGGGFADRAEDETDVYHTCFSIAALSLLKYPGLKDVDPLYCLPLDVTRRLGINSVHLITLIRLGESPTLVTEIRRDQYRKRESHHRVGTVLASKIAEPFIELIKSQASILDKPPVLVGFLANDDEASQVYADFTGKTAEANNFRFDLRKCDKEELEDKIMEANFDPEVDGIMVYFPVFGSRQQVIAREKDVEGLCHYWVQNMYHNIRYIDPPHNTKKSILPCTPLAIVKILEHLQIYNSILNYGNRLYGKTIAIVNRSEVVGRPLAALLANDGAKVYSVDVTGVQLFTRGQGIRLKKHESSDTNLKLEDVIPLSDVIVSGVPSPSYKIPTELVRDGACCINFSSEKNFETDKIKERAGIYVPSVGKVTIAMLLRNLLRLRDNRTR